MKIVEESQKLYFTTFGYKVELARSSHARGDYNIYSFAFVF